MSETAKLLADIEAYLARSGMTASAFGHLVVNDGKLVERLRSGRTVTLETAAKIRSLISRRPRKRNWPSDESPKKSDPQAA